MIRRLLCILGIHSMSQCFSDAGDFRSCRFCDFETDY